MSTDENKKTAGTTVYTVYWKVLTDTPTAVKKDGRSFNSFSRHFESLLLAQRFKVAIMESSREFGFDYFELLIKETDIFSDESKQWT